MRSLEPAPTQDQRTAILRLLDDDDAATIALVQAKLAETETLPSLQVLRAEAHGRAAENLEEVITVVAQNEANARFSEVCRTFAENGDLEHASWAMASVFAPGEDFAPMQSVLDYWGEEVTRLLSGVLTKAERVRTLADFLGRDMRLRGNDDDYYALENSLLPRVIENRLGIPISLTLVYMLVAKRAGFQVDGVGLPGHFLARHEDVIFDPFHGGRRISLDECAALMEKQNLVLTPAHLAPTSSRLMLIRMLTNIYYIAEQQDPPLTARISMWLDLLRRS